MVTITCLGGGKEVGRASIKVSAKEEKFLLDYGIEVQDMKVPLDPGKDITSVFLSHAHLDHSGYIPNLYKKGYNGKVYATPVTFGLAGLLLRDSIKVQGKKGLQPQFLLDHVKKMERLKAAINTGKDIRFKKSTVKLFNAGHVPGSCSTLIEADGKKVLYTGDIKFTSTSLTKGAFDNYRNIDVLVTESTYSYRNHPNRKELLDSLRELAQKTVYKNGILLLPAFAVGRTQELLTVLYDLGFKTYMDGMGIEATRVMLSHPKSIRDPKRLAKAFGAAHKIKNFRQRTDVVKNPCVIITTAGMLNGGPISYYIKKLHKRSDCALVMSGYQVDGTVGRRLLDTGIYMNEGINVKPKMDVSFLDLSAHCGRDSLLKFIRKVKPKKVVLVHGDRTGEFALELKGMGFDAYAPSNGDSIEA